MKNILSTSILALAGMAFLVPTAKAGLYESANYQEGDLVIAFSNASAPPAHTGNTYMVDFGNISLFTTGGIFATGSPVVVNSGSGSGYLADLATAGISTSTATYSIFGADFSQHLSLTQTHGSAALQNGNTGGANDMLSVILDGDTAAASSTVARSFTQNTSAPGTTYANYNLGSLSPTLSWENYTNAEGTLSQILDLYAVDENGTGNGTRIGSFEFDKTTGALTFSSTGFDAVPEPGTFAFGFALIGACAMGRFRRRQAAELVA